ncbi:single-stranded DNA-binding protein [Actinomycetospora corticicola]
MDTVTDPDPDQDYYFHTAGDRFRRPPIHLTGNLTADPERPRRHPLHYRGRLSLAHRGRRVGRRRAQLPPAERFGERGEHVAESLTKGARVVVPGTITARSWTPDAGRRTPAAGGRSGEDLDSSRGPPRPSRRACSG